MKTLLVCLLIAATAAPVTAGPDFITPNPRTRELAASSGTNLVAPVDDILFSLDSAALTPAAQAQIASAARWLKRYPDHRVVLEGYTDATGLAIYNADLATRRAAMVRNHLIALGIPRDRIVLVVFGEAVARPQHAVLDRRVIVYATDRPVREIVTASLEHKHALEAVWTERGALYTETALTKHRRDVVGAR